MVETRLREKRRARRRERAISRGRDSRKKAPACSILSSGLYYKFGQSEDKGGGGAKSQKFLEVI